MRNWRVVLDVNQTACRRIIVVLCLHIYRAYERLLIFSCCRLDFAARSGRELRYRVLLRWLCVIENIHLLSARAHGETSGGIVAERAGQARFLLVQQLAILQINLIRGLLLLIYDAGRSVLSRTWLYLRHVNSFPPDLVGDVWAFRL